MIIGRFLALKDEDANPHKQDKVRNKIIDYAIVLAVITSLLALVWGSKL